MTDSKSPQKEEKIPERKELALPLDWHVPDNIPTNRVTNMVAQILEDEFVLSFFEQRGPLITDDYSYEKATQLKSVNALCVARVCITPARLEGFIKVLNQQLQQYEKLKNSTTTPS